jgi:uncharacterized protein
MKKIAFILICMLTCVLAQAGIYTPESLPNPSLQNSYVCNPNDIISTSDYNFLNQLATQLEETTDVELCVVALQSIGEMDAFDFSYELFQRWGIGKEGKNTGVLVLLALESRDIRIMTGGGIEGILTDAICHNIIQEYAIPPMKQGDYSGGLSLVALRIFEECTKDEVPEELLNMTSATNRYHYTKEEPSLLVTLGFAIIFIGICALILWLISRPKICPHCKQRAFRQTSDKIITRATTLTAGLGKHVYTCKHCGYQEEKNYIIPKQMPLVIHGSSSSSGRGFGGGSFGGGSTFGGGAGGKF